MLHSPIAVCCAALLIATLPAQREGRGRDQSPTLKNFTIEAGALKSDKVREGEAGYSIYLPKGYTDEANKDKKYPWVLWLPGFGGPDEFQQRGGAEVLDRLRGEDQLPEIAMVVFRAPARRGRSVYMNGEAASDTEDLIVGDFTDQLQKKYRLATETKQRAVMGVSAGGFGAMKIAMRHPDAFGAVAVHSAAILPADPEELAGMNETIVQRQLRGDIAKELGNPIDKAKWGAHMPLAIVATKKFDDMKGMQIYFDVGSDDGYGFCEPNEKLSKVMTEHGWKHFFHKVEDGGHAWSSPKMKENVARSLRFVGAAVTGKDAVATMSETKPAGEKKEEPKKEEIREDAKKEEPKK
ncbi:MAG TPA: alpha/beta hydrolase-fold protein [Planctomycetota bacterium]